MIKILLDQGLPRSSVKILKNEGWDIVHTGDLGLSHATDQQLLEYARKEDRIIITLDSDFHTILATENASSPSVIRVRQERLKSPEFAKLITNIFPKIHDDLINGAMVTVTEDSIRIRRIPLLNSNP